MRTIGVCCTALVVLAVVVGCGGGGGGAPPVLDGTVRAQQAGDQWEYSITGTANNGVETIPFTGTGTTTVTSQTVITPKGVTAYVSQTSMSLALEGQTYVFSIKSYLTQDSTGTVYQHGGEDEDGVWWVDFPAAGYYISTASPMSQGMSWGAYIVKSTGETEDMLSTIVGTETISVPAGQFATFKTSISGYFAGYPVVGTSWSVPQIGSDVKMDFTMSNIGEGISLNMTVVLTAKNRGVSGEITNGRPLSDIGELFTKPRR